MAATDSDISDVELRRQLKAFGEDVGPITDSTRTFLLRKLKRLRNEQGSSRSSTGKSPARRRPSPGRKSLSATTRNQSPTRKLIGFSSDEEDSGPSYSSTEIDSSKSRGRRRETANHDETAGSSGKTKPFPTRRSGLRHRVPSFIDSVSERTLDDTTDDRQVLRIKRKGRSSGVTRNYEIEREREESERSEITIRPSSSYGNEESVTADAELNTTLRHRQVGAKDVKTSSFTSSKVKILLVISAICIGILLYAVLKNHSSEKEPLEQLVKLPVCKGDNEVETYGNLKPPDCVQLVNISKQYANSLHKKLTIKAGLFECQDPSVKGRNVSVKEFTKQIRVDKYKRHADEQKLIYNGTLQLILEHPDWKLRLFDKNNKETTAIENVTWIDTSVSVKPLLCRIKEAMSRLAYFSVMIGFGIGGLVIAYFIVRQRWRKEEEETRLMYQFVENIIDILREHHEASKTEKNLLPYLPIPHVRDMLIPPSDRQRLFKAWNKAVRFLSANESRIRVESQRIAGEDFEVWRWIHIATPKPHNPKLSLSERLTGFDCKSGVELSQKIYLLLDTNLHTHSDLKSCKVEYSTDGLVIINLQSNKHGKYWQGQAFENFQSAVNPPVISPTPCLKIRNMFDPDVETEDGWHVMIQDAVLEKCIENGAGVVHIAVDKSSSEGCVYVKCDTHHSAGLAFRSLHGCWFDGRLVAVKYLTLKRYHQRFPVALEATERLGPSGASPSSLVTFNPDEEGEDINDSDVEF